MSEHFYAEVPAFTHFEGVMDQANYRPLPDDWILAASDIVSSTKAIQSGRYKAVNMAGASVISALLNALGHRNLPFVFGGDGALVAIPASARAAAAAALAAVQAWVADELDLALRAALVPISVIRANGHDVRVARFQVNDEVSYAMFSGGGAAWAESEMKAGRYVVAPAPPGTRPDLTGLSCRWNPIAARHGEILSVIALPVDERAVEFRELVLGIIELASEEERDGHPIVAEGPHFALMPHGLNFEVRAFSSGRLDQATRRIALWLLQWLGVALDRLGLTLGRFDPKVYRRDLAQNSDFRKFDDGLKMTIDIDAARSLAIERRLAEASRGGICRYGLHRQNSALMTCIVPSPLTRDHMHFIDGGSGGYAMAASRLKSAAA